MDLYSRGEASTMKVQSTIGKVWAEDFGSENVYHICMWVLT